MPDRQPAALRTWSAARVQIFALVEVGLQGRIGIVPRTEVAHLAADLLRPAPGRVRKQGEIGVRLGGLLFGLRHGGILSGVKSGVTSCSPVVPKMAKTTEKQG